MMAGRMIANNVTAATSTAPLVSIIVVSFNTRDLTLECLRTLEATTTTPYQLIVIDNASHDGSAEAVAAAYPNALLMAETENHGFAAANNIASAHAVGEYLLLLNPDVVVLDGAVDNLVAFAEARPAARIWGGRTLHADGGLNPTNCWRRMSYWSLLSQAAGLTSVFRRSALFNPESYGGWARSEEREVDIVSGCFLLMKTEDWRRLGGFDPTFVMYGEEADLCLRARADGAAPRVTPDASIVHFGGASQNVRADRMVRLLRAKMTLARRHLRPFGSSMGAAMLALWPLSRAIGARLLGRAEARDVWGEVWRRRGEWYDGYPTLAHGPLRPAPGADARP